MNHASLWQTQVVEQLSKLFAADPDAKAFVLAGSLADQTVNADWWSDIDVKIVLADVAVGRYFESLIWLHPFGHVIGVEKYDGESTKTLRVCFEDFKRVDFVFVAESAAFVTSDLFNPPCSVIWSRIPQLRPIVESDPQSTKALPLFSLEELNSFADKFWFKASVAIAKVVRNDLLIGGHLALDLMRDCLVLQMIQRDQKTGVNIHREGGWGNEVIERFSLGQGESGFGQALDLLTLIEQSGALFDEIALDMSAEYALRGAYLLPTIELARRTSETN